MRVTRQPCRLSYIVTPSDKVINERLLLLTCAVLSNRSHVLPLYPVIDQALVLKSSWLFYINFIVDYMQTVCMLYPTGLAPVQL